MFSKLLGCSLSFASVPPGWLSQALCAKRLGFTTVGLVGVAGTYLGVEHVAVRVAQGGHDIPEAVIRRRFEKGWSNFQDVYRELVDSWRLYDNSGEQAVLLQESEQHES